MIGDNVIKKREFDALKEHIVYILNRMQEELTQFSDHSIDVDVERKRKQYCMEFRYFRKEEETDTELYEKKITEFRECVERLRWRYEVDIHSDEAWAEAKIKIRV